MKNAFELYGLLPAILFEEFQLWNRLNKTFEESWISRVLGFFEHRRDRS